jgi:hypothetical protein
MKADVEVKYLKVVDRVSKKGTEYYVGTFLTEEMDAIDLGVNKEVVADLRCLESMSEVVLTVDIRRTQYGLFCDVVGVKNGK